MPNTTFQRVVFTNLGVLLMATTVVTYKKYLVYGEFALELFKQVATDFCLKVPLVWILQFFEVQKFDGKQAVKYPTDNRILYKCIRTGFTVFLVFINFQFTISRNAVCSTGKTIV